MVKDTGCGFQKIHNSDCQSHVAEQQGECWREVCQTFHYAGLQYLFIQRTLAEQVGLPREQIG